VFPEHFTARQRVIHRAIDGSVARADRVLTISEFTRGELRRTYPRLAPGRVVNAGAGVDRRVFRRDPRARATLEELERRRDFRLPDRFVLAAGNLQPRKNLPRLLEAFARVRGSDPSLGLVVAGRETGRDPGLRRALAADAAVTWTDWVSRPELVALYSACRLFVYPSLYEGFGLPVLEAMACGAPVITSRGSAPEEVCPVPDALFDPRSVQDIAARMERSLTDDAAARLRAEQAGLPARHSWAAVADRTLDVYRSVEDGRQSSSDAFTSASSSSISSAK
ncbi:MAG TPA: glycosyltransferase family 1 protein, partial [bacterium]|nr:glycosyltransferase family 1 protein [bacterium]